MASGVTVADECKSVFEEIKSKKKHRFVIYYIKDEKQVCVEKIGERGESYDDFVQAITSGGSNDCRYGIFDMEYKHQTQGTTEASLKQKLILMSYCPDTARIKQKMIYASSLEALKKPLVGVAKVIQATDMSEVDYECVLEKVRQMDRQ